jgi:hypothetical protein
MLPGERPFVNRETRAFIEIAVPGPSSSKQRETAYCQAAALIYSTFVAAMWFQPWFTA